MRPDTRSFIERIHASMTAEERREMYTLLAAELSPSEIYSAIHVAANERQKIDRKNMVRGDLVQGYGIFIGFYSGSNDYLDYTYGDVGLFAAINDDGHPLKPNLTSFREAVGNLLKRAN